MNLRLHHDPWGRLVFTDDAGVAHVGVEPVRAFPISDPDRGIAILDHHGNELAWIEDLRLLSAELRSFLDGELSRRHFLPVVTKIHAIDGIADPRTWTVDTDRGRTSFPVKSDEDIRRVSGSRVLIVDWHGIRYLIPDYRQLDSASRRLLERFI